MEVIWATGTPYVFVFTDLKYLNFSGCRLLLTSLIIVCLRSIVHHFNGAHISSQMVSTVLLPISGKLLSQELRVLHAPQ